jgi:hypothetical protein
MISGVMAFPLSGFLSAAGGGQLLSGFCCQAAGWSIAVRQ